MYSVNHANRLAIQPLKPVDGQGEPGVDVDSRPHTCWQQRAPLTPQSAEDPGFAIARRAVEAHGGVIRAINRQEEVLNWIYEAHSRLCREIACHFQNALKHLDYYLETDSVKNENDTKQY